MKREIVQTVLVCDWCGSEENVRSYTFRHEYMDEDERPSKEDVSLELCADCQHRAYESLKSTGALAKLGETIRYGIFPCAQKEKVDD